MIYAIDFDGTIVEDKYPEIGKPNERLISYLKHFKWIKSKNYYHN